MVVFFSFLKAAKIVVLASLFQYSTGDSGSLSNDPHFDDDPTPGDSFPHNMFYSAAQNGGGSRAGTHRGF